jgi:hypothetical protein
VSHRYRWLSESSAIVALWIALLVCLATATLLRRTGFVRLAGLLALAFFLALLAGLRSTGLLILANLVLAWLLVAWSILLLLLATIGIVTWLLLTLVRIVAIVRHTQSLLVSGAVDLCMKEIFYVSPHRCCALHRA